MKGYLHSLPKADYKRQKNDLYPTPAYVTMGLLSRTNWPNQLCEPACGEGHISKVLVSRGYSVLSTDIADTGYGVSGIDFLASKSELPPAITNPPYGLVNEFIKQLTVRCRRFAVLLRLHGVVSRGRFDIYKEIPSIKLLIYTTPIYQMQDGIWKRGSAFTHLWLVADMDAKFKRSFDWIDIDKHEPLEAEL